MFCPHCGSQVPDGAAFCSSCGAPVSNNHGPEPPQQNPIPQDAALNYVMPEPEVPRGSSNAPVDPKAFVNGVRRPIKTNRNILLYIVLSIITLGIYSYYFVYKLAQDINIMCANDGEKTGGLVAFILLSFVTCGIYEVYWMYKIANRLYNNAPSYGLRFNENGTTILLWYVVGLLLCFLGPIIAMYFIVRNTNAMASAYNARYVYGR